MLIDELKEHMPKIKEKVDSRINEFESLYKKGNEEWFKELCFCLMTANFSAEKGWRLQNTIGSGFWTLSEENLASELKRYGHRFPNMRAKFIYAARPHKNYIKDKMIEEKENNREWLVENVKGLGFKEASHFLRNVGILDYAIVDRHILRMINEKDNYELPKTLTKGKYLEIETYLKNISKELNITQGELDLYIWHMATGKILK